MIQTPGAPLARLSASAFATLAILLTWAAPPVQAQASACNPSLHPVCYNVTLLGCAPANKVCGFGNFDPLFVCACRTACTNSQACAGDEACFKGNCSPDVICNNSTDCATTGIADAVCSSDTGRCVKAPPPPPPGCTADTSLCRTVNACNGTRSCDAASGGCVTGPPVLCPQPGPIIEMRPDGTFGFVPQHAHCEPVGGSSTETICVTTQDPLPPVQCPADPVDNPNLVFTPTGVGLVPFKYTATLRDKTYKAGAQPQVAYVRLANARGADAMLASTAPKGKADGSDWKYDKKDAAWHWTRSDAASPIESVTLKPLGGQRVRVQVTGAAKMANGSFTPAKSPPVPPSPRTILYAIETGIGWAQSSQFDPQRVQPSCTVVVGNCQQSANGGLNCHVPGWKPGRKD